MKTHVEARAAARERKLQAQTVRARASARSPSERDPRAPQRAGDAAGEDTFQQYLGDLGAYSLLNGPEELALGREIEEGEIAHWRALLARPDALDPILCGIEGQLASPPELEQLRKLASKGTRAIAATPRWQRAVDKAARALREADQSRVGLARADALVRARFTAQRGVKRYLSTVDGARRAHEEPKNRLVTANLRLVVSMARRYNQKLMPLADLVQEGNLGLLRAAERFDHRRGLRFSTYASWWIRHALNRGLSDRGRLVRVPVHALDDMQRIGRATGPVFAQTGEMPDLAELAQRTGLPEERLSPLLQLELGRVPMSLDRKLGDDSDATALDMLPADEEPAGELLDAASWQAEAEQLLATLPSIEAAILRYRFGFEGGEELTLREIGEKYNLSRERIRQLQEQALLKLRLELAKRRGVWEHNGDRAA